MALCLSVCCVCCCWFVCFNMAIIIIIIASPSLSLSPLLATSDISFCCAFNFPLTANLLLQIVPHLSSAAVTTDSTKTHRPCPPHPPRFQFGFVCARECVCVCPSPLRNLYYVINLEFNLKLSLSLTFPLFLPYFARFDIYQRTLHS